jgi:hypothetical protein
MIASPEFPKIQAVTMFTKLIQTAGILFFGAALGLVAFFVVATIKPSYISEPEAPPAVEAEAEPPQVTPPKSSKAVKGDAELLKRLVALETQVKDLSKLAAGKAKVEKPAEASSSAAMSKAVADLQNNVRTLQTTVAALQKDLAKTKAQTASVPPKGPTAAAAPPPSTTLAATSIAAAPAKAAAATTPTVREVPAELPPTASRPTTKSDAQIKQELIRLSIASYSGSCPCPYNTDRAGRSCGARSAYSRPGGSAPLCYDRDVTQRMVEEYRLR